MRPRLEVLGPQVLHQEMEISLQMDSLVTCRQMTPIMVG